MSLTVASAALDLAWAEFGAVAYTASTLTNISSCIDYVQDMLNRGTLGTATTPTLANVSNSLVRAKQELAETERFTYKRRYVTATLTAGTYRYAMPPDFAGVISLRDKTNDHKIHVTTPHQFDYIYPDVAECSNSKIIIATAKNNELWVAPPPDGADVLEMEYYRTGDDVSAQDISWLPEVERFRICDFALGESFQMLDQYEKAQFYFGRWERGLRKAAKGDGKKRWSTSGYRAKSIFQA